MIPTLRHPPPYSVSITFKLDSYQECFRILSRAAYSFSISVLLNSSWGFSESFLEAAYFSIIFYLTSS